MIQNLLETRVLESYGSLVDRFPEFCGCEVCQEDVLVYALNRLPPKYVTSIEGHTVSDVALASHQERTMIDVAVMDGIRRVAAAPRCTRGAGT